MRHFRFIVKHTFSISFNSLIVFFNNSRVDCWSSFVHVVCIDATCSVLNCRHFVTVEHVGIFSVTIFILCCQIVHVNFTQWMQRVWNWFWLHVSSIRNKTNIRFVHLVLDWSGIFFIFSIIIIEIRMRYIRRFLRKMVTLATSTKISTCQTCRPGLSYSIFRLLLLTLNHILSLHIASAIITMRIVIDFILS